MVEFQGAVFDMNIVAVYHRLVDIRQLMVKGN